MTLWLILGAMSAIAVAALLFGLRRGRAAPTARAEHDLAVYRAQLEELERDLKRGVLDESEAESARLEVQRRVLAADAARAEDGGHAKGSRALGVAAALLVPVAALAIYLWLGSPEIESQPFAERIAETPGAAEGQSGKLPDVETMMARLRDRLAEDPDDVEGWISLGQVSMLLGRLDQAIEGYSRALTLSPGLPEAHSGLGEAYVLRADGVITQAARESFEAALVGDPDEPRARFYLAVAREQDGDTQGALDGLIALLEDAPPDAGWTDSVRQAAAVMADKLGLDPGTVLPAPAATAMPQASPAAAERLAAQLAENPKDFEGWIALARMRAALGDPEGARAALAEGGEVYQGAPFVQEQFQRTAVELGLEAGGGGPSAADVAALQEMSAEDRDAVIRDMVAGLAARLQEQPDDIEGWRMLARSYRVLGEPAKSAEAFGKVAGILPDDMTAQLDYATALIEADEGPPPPEAVALLEKIVAREPTNPDALYYLGESAVRTGDAAGAALYWQRLLDQLPPDSEDYAWLKGRIEALAPDTQ